MLGVAKRLDNATGDPRVCPMSKRQQTEIAIFAAAFAQTLAQLDGNAGYTGAEKATMAHASGTAAVRAYELACPKEDLEFEDLPRPCVAQDVDGDQFRVCEDGSWQYLRGPGVGGWAQQRWPAEDPPGRGPFKIVE